MLNFIGTPDSRELRRTLWVVVGFLFVWLLAASSPTSVLGQRPAEVAESSDEVLEDEGEEAEEDEGEEDEEEDEHEDEDLEELRGARSELRQLLKRQQQAVTKTQRRIREIDKFLALTKRARKLEEQLELAKEADKEEQVKVLAAQLEKLETEIEVGGQLLKLEYELVEVEERIAEADREEDDERLELLETLADGLRRIRAITQELLPIYLHGPESEEGPLERLKAETLTRKVEKAFRALDVLEELREAEEEEDEKLVEELEEKLDKLREAMHADNESKKQDADAQEKVTSKPELQPILVTKETLAPFAKTDLREDVAPLLRKYCFECHSNESSSGELNLEKLLVSSPIVKQREQWINVIEQTKNHVMPPEDEAQPSLDERKMIALSLHNAVHNFDYSGIKNPGFEAARRLTHREYSNTVRDLFGIDIDVVDRFPADLTATSGFDNSANSLFIQPLLMERYIGIAEYVVDKALPNNPQTPEQKRVVDRVFVSRPSAGDGVEDSARKVFTLFLGRAYRRPPTDDEVGRFAGQVDRAVSNGLDFESAVKATLQTVLITPSFLLHTEESPSESSSAFAITDWELASRLSYFLWASMPDDELFELARKKELSQPKVLETQIRRMIEHPRSNSLGTVFASQWLGSHHLGVRMRMDPIDNPWCTESLMAAMRNETSMFFNTLVRENRPITELVDADYTFLNEELAKLYRIKGVSCEKMQRVQLKTKNRGGIFGHGSLLAITSFPYRTSPVVRGKWILDNVLGTPPPPPPPNVSELSEDIEENDRLSFREKLELHREKPNCYACHSQMDPLGFSLEQFDWFGRYRTRQGRRRIDARGELPNGTEFKGLTGLKKVIVEQRRDDLVRQVTKKMLSYALGRQLEYYDEPAIRSIVANVTQDGDRLQTLIGEIVNSYPFRYKQKPPQQKVASKFPSSIDCTR